MLLRSKMATPATKNDVRNISDKLDKISKSLVDNVDVSLTLWHTSTSCESDLRCPMRCWRRYSGSRLLETRNRQESWEVTLYTLLPRVLHGFYDAKRQHLSTIKTDGDLSFTIIQQQTYRRKQLMDQPDDNSLTALPTKKRTSKVLRDRKYMHRKMRRKTQTHSTNGVNIESRVT